MSKISVTSDEQFQEQVGSYFDFPMHLPEFIAELEAEGFEIQETRKIAKFYKQTMFCRSEWRIIWSLDGQAVSSVKSMYFYECWN